MNKKVAFITGISGMDGANMARLLLSKNYIVHGTIRRTSTPNTQRIDDILSPEIESYIHYGDLADNSIIELIYKIKPDEIYNFAAQSHVRISFDIPVYTGEVTGLGVLRLLEGIRVGIKNGILSKDIKFYTACSSEQFGKHLPPQSLDTPMVTCSPYGASKLFAYNCANLYRDGYNMFVVAGILFNHTHTTRGVNFVERKITIAAAKIYYKLQKTIALGNLLAKRDWGWSPDFVNGVHKMMQYPTPENWLLATGETHTIEEFAIETFNYLNLDFKKYVTYDNRYERPQEVPALQGDYSKAKEKLHWYPTHKFKDIIKLMVESDLKLVAEGKI